MTALTVAGYVLAISGAIVFIGAGAGLRRFTDPYMRASAVATAGGLGVALVTLGAALTMPTTSNLVKALIAVVLQLTTSAVAAMIIGRAAVNTAHEFAPTTDTSALQQMDAEQPGRDHTHGPGSGPAGAGSAGATEPSGPGELGEPGEPSASGPKRD